MVGYSCTPSRASLCVSDSPKELSLHNDFLYVFGNMGVAVITIFYLHFSFKSCFFCVGGRGME